MKLSKISANVFALILALPTALGSIDMQASQLLQTVSKAGNLMLGSHLFSVYCFAQLAISDRTSAVAF